MSDDKLRQVYEARWGRTLDAARAALRSGERDLSRLVHRIHRDTTRKQPAGPLLGQAFGLEPGAVSFALQRVARAFVADTLLDHADGVDAVVDLGSGWGYNIFNLWLRGGPDVRYHALEFVAPGREACDLIAAALPGPRVISAPFDFRAPELPALGVSHALVFSAHSLDKVATIPACLIDAIAGVADRVTVLHFENLHVQLAEAFGLPVQEEQRRLTAKGLLNTNLHALLTAAAAEGRIRIDEIRPDTLGGTSSLVRWSAGLSR